MPLQPALRRIGSLAAWLAWSSACLGLGEAGPIETVPAPGDFPLCHHQSVAPLVVDAHDFPGVRRAARDLQEDLYRVTAHRPLLILPEATTSAWPAAGQSNLVLVGTLGHSELIDRLARAGKIGIAGIQGQWEASFLQVVPQPWPGVASALVIVGSDQRGTIYGLYALSEQIGVSPWYYWCDVPVKNHRELFVRPERQVLGPPSVKYRGIFLNDEAPALTEWVREHYGTVPGLPGVANYGRGFYTNVFELLLRLRGNYLWPAMWNNAFNEDDPDNPRLANEYGIVMGTSHQEPMLRAQKEWDRSDGKTNGAWDYHQTNQQPVLQQFWRAGVRRNRAYESIFTLGLRAENDSAAELGKDLTEQVIEAQRRILAEEISPDLARIPQLWCLYKEVQGYYREGLRVPPDVTLLWAEDNWGNLRRVPSAEERLRPGGAGVYYHFDYHGGPRSYQWINTSPLPKVWDQLALAKQYGADRIWLVNVGHLNKSGEFPLEFFLRFAWDTARWNQDHLAEFTRLWAAREFGPRFAKDIAALVTDYTKFNGRRKPELLDASTYSLLNYREFETVTADYARLAQRAEAVGRQLPAESRDAFYGMIQYPIQAAAGLHAMYLAAAKNSLYGRQGRASAGAFAQITRAEFAAQTNLASQFNATFAGGKWNHFMDQPYIGYRSWSPPPANNLDAVTLEAKPVPVPAAMGVAVEGERDAAGGSLAFDRFGQISRYIDVFNRGQTPFAFTAKPSAPWIRLTPAHGTITAETRVEVSVAWGRAPAGSSQAEVDLSGANSHFTVKLRTFNPNLSLPAGWQGFVEADGYVAMEAEHFASRAEAGSSQWLRIPDYGLTLSGMRATGPPDTQLQPGPDSPCLGYRMYLFHSGAVTVDLLLSPTLNVLPVRPLRYALAFDDQAPQIVTAVPADFDAHNGNRDWEETVMDNCRHSLSTQQLDLPGLHTLHLWMVDPAVVVQRIMVNTGGMKPSYLGPPESFRHPGTALPKGIHIGIQPKP